jgi:hypothetical protein
MRPLIAVCLAVSAFVAAQGGENDSPVAKESDAALARLLARSNTVLAGTIVSDPVKLEVAKDARPSHEGSVTYRCDFAVTEVLKGSAPGPKQVIVHVSRWADSDEELPAELRKGGKCILFLFPMYPTQVRPYVPQFGTTDHWFGIQRYSAKMAGRLKEMAKEEERRPNKL